MKTQEQHLRTLKARFEASMPRHQGVVLAKVQARLEAKPAALKSLHAMKSTGGEPDVIGGDEKSGFIFCDCSA